jgi:predicted oxidoreductase
MENLTTQGIALPRLGLGTFRMQGDVCRAAVESALALGYRHIDTAEMYANEEAIGAAIAASGVVRKDLHVTTKVWNENLAPEAMRRAFDKSLKKLRLDQVDLYLVHWPAPNMNLPAMFETLMKLKEEGRTRAIGVANFNTALLKTVVEEIRAPIACNQIEYHVMLDQTKGREISRGKIDSARRLLSAGAGPRRFRRNVACDRQEAWRQRGAGGAELAARSGWRRSDSEDIAPREPKSQSRCAESQARRRRSEEDRRLAEE